MSDLTNEELRRVVLRDLRRVGKRFADDPTPTDGTIQAAVARIKAKPDLRKTAAIKSKKVAAAQRRRA